ncbi:MAG: hypothetical protein V8R75_12075, partial [Oscillospiraceae bacterium]
MMETVRWFYEGQGFGPVPLGGSLRPVWWARETWIQAALPKHFVLCFQWYLAQKKMGWTADFECVLFLALPT